MRTHAIGTSTTAIEAAEAELGRTLPKSFVAWLLLNNGRSLGALVVFPVFDARNPRKTWDSIVRHVNEDWRAWRDTLAEAPVDLSGLLPFAEFGTGDYYCFDYRRLGVTGEPVVVRWSHETGETVHMAEDFAAFLAIRVRVAG
ncbi:SMI1/KNR4 family protein [Burkholderia ubonensis]|uniref:SMI1/KNR4 family protein n=1 Tax=Burkholderia ubonensis TaxID=101571 RepID=UPI000ADBD420|nr:SMI1/KNR4 family protein [Burkholderia ubonensis]